MNNVIGELSLHFEGYGFVVPKKRGEVDVFIPARWVGDCLHGDLVEVKVSPSKRGLFEGKIVRILEHSLKQIVGRLEKNGKQWQVVAEEKRVRHPMLLKEHPEGVEVGDYVVARITQYPEGNKPLCGEVIEKLPKRGTLMNEIEYVIAKHQWPKEFPAKVVAEAEKIKGRTRDLGTGTTDRKDLRELSFVTIDGDDAKDFDDAVCAENLPGGNIRLWVAIADVSHYVTPGSLLDQEAYERSTSVYFPGRVLPMLPEVLSNDLCSLRPNEDRLVLVAEFEIDKQGRCTNETFYPAIFQSQARLTYSIVKKILEDRDEKFVKMYQPLVPMLETLSQAAKRLKAQRTVRGSLDFDLPEPEIILDFTGGISDIEKRIRFWSHQIIEELMIAANEAVARFLTEKKIGCLYRIHDGPKPEKIRLFYKLAQRLGYRGHFPEKMSVKHLQEILNTFENHAEQRLINTLLLRSMAQAIYSPYNIGHFGLGSGCYCHFTSPIRRYPDLVIHRLMKMELGTKKMLQTKLEEMAEKTSSQERKAMMAEREMLALHQAMFIQEKKGEVLEGIISHVTKMGFFVELLEYFLEGMVLKQDLKGDEYIFDEEHLRLRGQKHKKIFKIGDRITIKVGEANIPERRIFFKLLDSGARPPLV